MKVIDAKNPTWWVVENVMGASKDFTEFLNKEPTQFIAPFMLWGNFPQLPFFQNKLKTPKNKNLMSGGGPMSANKRALIPFELSFELLQTWNQQTSLMEWL